MSIFYILGKFLHFYPQYKLEEVLKMKYNHFRELSKQIKVLKAEEKLSLLRIMENQVYLKYPKLINKHSELYKEFIDTINEATGTIKDKPKKFEKEKLIILKEKLKGAV